MKKFKKKSEEDINQELFDDVINNDSPQEAEKANNEDEDKFNPNGYEIVIDRVQHGLVGTLKIEDDLINKPIFKPGDFVHFIAPARLEKKDFILYQSHDNYFIRRIIKFVNDDIYVAGDNEKEYHITHKDDVIGKAIGRQRKKKYISFSLNPTKKFYTFKKVNLAKMRLGNRVMNYDEDLSQESYEIAMQNIEANLSANNQTQQVKVQTPIASDIDLDSDLASFLNPDDLVREIRNQNVDVADEELNPDEEIIEEALEEVTEDVEESTDEEKESEEEIIEEEEEE